MTKKLNFSIIWKAVVIGVLILLMLIPLAFIRGTVKGRLEYKDEATSKITNSWGSKIAIAAPTLNISVSRKVGKVNAEGKTTFSYISQYAKFAPQNADVDVNMISQIRYIGIFKTPVFTADITMKGSFANIKFENSDDIKYFPEKSYVSLELNDLKGINIPEFSWNGKKYDFEPSTLGNPLSLTIPNSYEYLPKMSYARYYERDENYTLKSLSSLVPFDNKNADFEIKFSIKGSGGITFIPLAKDNTFRIYSKWANPNFSGAFLPDTKEITKDGFDARWKINYMASAIPQNLDDAAVSQAAFTTSLLAPVDSYRSAERAAKYGILFVILTFIACFVFEITSKKPVHPFQYLLVGLAMTVYYILLLSISEFVSFGLAYFIAAAAIILMITLYAKFGVSKTLSVKQTAVIAAAFSALYGYLYVLLQLQDMALIFGSIGLFFGLAAVMYATRNISWYDEAQ
ncbi:MAG: cell envelope integrity protein CreD [Endomicrobium sp.]|jgi:inner membrane protein|nr:cell envelope integrity protein CreD [Endomicrobium sp.]